MNYRHIYHAGNFADVVKHLTMVLCLDYLQQKQTPLCILDAHGGQGLYPLFETQAQKTKEWEGGIGAFRNTDPAAMPADFLRYWHIAAGSMPSGFYAGSPLIMAKMLRPQDRLFANELHPEEKAALMNTLTPFSKARVMGLDAYTFLRASLPPKEKRGLIVIDPPFEKKDEFEKLSAQISAWKSRFATGVYILWYPIKTHLRVNLLKDTAQNSGFSNIWCLEVFRHPPDTDLVFTGAGLLIFNTPHGIPQKISALLPFLSKHMSLHSTRTSWLTDV